VETYHIDEVVFGVPGDWQDNSINIFAVGNTTPASFSFVINRERMNKDEEIVDFANRQLSQLGETLNEFEIIEQRQLDIDGSFALEAEFRWLATEGKMHQRQAFVPVGRKVLILTSTALDGMTDEQNQQLTAVYESIQLRQEGSR
jgi:hypothetical protein